MGSSPARLLVLLLAHLVIGALCMPNKEQEGVVPEKSKDCCKKTVIPYEDVLLLETTRQKRDSNIKATGEIEQGDCCKNGRTPYLEDAVHMRNKRDSKFESVDLAAVHLERVEDSEWDRYCTKLLRERSSRMEFVDQDRCDTISCYKGKNSQVMAINITCKIDFPSIPGCHIEATNTEKPFPKCCPKQVCPEGNVHILPSGNKSIENHLNSAEVKMNLPKQLKIDIKQSSEDDDSVYSVSSSEEMSEDHISNSRQITPPTGTMEMLMSKIQTGSTILDQLKLTRPLAYYQFKINENKLMKNVKTGMHINEKLETVQSLLDKIDGNKNEESKSKRNEAVDVLQELKDGVHCLYHLKKLFYTLLCKKVEPSKEETIPETVTVKPRAEELTYNELQDLHDVFSGINETISWFGITITDKQLVKVLHIVKDMFIYGTEKNERKLKKLQDMINDLIEEILNEYKSKELPEIINKNDTSVDKSVKIVVKATQIVSKWFGINMTEEQCKNLYESFCLLRKMIIYKQIDILEAVFKNPEESFFNTMMNHKYKLNDLRKKRDILILEPYLEEDRKEISKKHRIDNAKKYVEQQREKLKHEELVLNRMDGTVKEVFQDRPETEEVIPDRMDLKRLWDLWKMVIETIMDMDKDEGQVILKFAHVEDNVMDKQDSNDDQLHRKDMADFLLERESFLTNLKDCETKISEDTNPENHVDELAVTKLNAISNVIPQILEKRRFT